MPDNVLFIIGSVSLALGLTFSSLSKTSLPEYATINTLHITTKDRKFLIQPIHE